MPVEPPQSRPDPDSLLAKLKAEEAEAKRGKLKVFFGAAAGVGKTYAMLSAGRTKAMEGVDMVVGYAEPHARPETEMLLLGLEILPYHVVEYRGAKLKELDLDAALRRKPELILVDELAHSNAPGMRHAKRWQDVQELLDAGIDVYTTLNVQHLESLNDVVAQITGVTVRETLPDALFERADEIELVDLSPDELMDRLREGKVYIPQQAEQAVQRFFRKPNLTALRELALRKTADHVSDDVETARRQELARQTWPTAERILVCISPSPTSAKVVRAAKRLALALHAEWIAAYVQTPSSSQLSAKARAQLLRNQHLAERLGAETVTLTGHDAVDELVGYAGLRNVTKIIAGKPAQPWWRDLLSRTIVDRLLRKSGDIDVYVVRGLPGKAVDADEQRTARPVDAAVGIPWADYGWSAAYVGVCFLVTLLLAWLWPRMDLSNLVMVYLVAVAAVALRYGRGPAAFAAVLSVAVFDFFFVPPRLTFAIADTQYLITFIVVLGVALLIATLTARIREQAEASRQDQRRTEALYRMTHELSAALGLSTLCDIAVRHLREVFHGRVALLLPDDSRRVAVRAASDAQVARPASEQAVAQWVFDHAQIAGRGTDTLPAAECLYLPLPASRGLVGVLAIASEDTPRLLVPPHRNLLEAFVNQIALVIERAHLAQEARQALVESEAEKMRSSLLSSVSHDLRTPLAVITGASSGLLEGNTPLPPAQRELIETIHDESNRLSRLVGNLLDITRLEGGGVTLNRQWQPLEEIVGSALNHVDAQLAGRAVTTTLPPDLPMVYVDGVLIDQVLINLLENAARYTPAASPIDIRAAADADAVTVEVADHGPGLPVGEEERVFEKFFRGAAASGHRGAGLGLPICRAILQAHGGHISAENRPGSDHGAVFRFTIPLQGSPPTTAEPDLAPDSSA